MPVAVEHLSKSFPGTQALDDVELTVQAGEIHALAGANGSGKSTLVKVLTGVYQPDDGWIVVDGRRLRAIHSPSEATHLGIRVVHQEAPLVDTLTVEECVALFRGYPVGAMGRVHWRALRATVGSLFQHLGVEIDPAALAGTLSPAQRALVSLAIALDDIESAGSKVLVLDEATASLPETDAELFLQRVRVLARSGMAVLMVTHRISEIPHVADVVTVLANGRVVHHGPSAEVDEDLIIAKMIGQATTRETDQAEQAASIQRLWTASGRAALEIGDRRIVLEVEHLAGGGSVRDVSFNVRAGEILGITGLSSSGVVELPYVLAGSLDRTSGAVRVNGRPYPEVMSPHRAMQAGVALVPADRLRQGGVRTLSVRENLVLPDAARYWRRGPREREVISAAIDELDIQPPYPGSLFERLSGGNQQKVVLAKWLLLQPSVTVLDEPTSGVDPRSRRLVFEAVRAAASRGMAVILLTNEHEQLIEICTRVLVMRGGVIAAELAHDAMTREALARWSYL